VFAAFAGALAAGVSAGFAGEFAAGFSFAGAAVAFPWGVCEFAGAAVFVFEFAFEFEFAFTAPAGRAPLSSFGLSTTFLANKLSIFASFMAIAWYEAARSCLRLSTSNLLICGRIFGLSSVWVSSFSIRSSSLK